MDVLLQKALYEYTTLVVLACESWLIVLLSDRDQVATTVFNIRSLINEQQCFSS
jgi:hypothetical protein